MEQRDLEETVVELESSGIQFCIQFVGSVIVEKSMNLLSSELKKNTALAYIKHVVHAADLIPLNNDIYDKEWSFIKEANISVSNVPIDMNISSTAIIIVENLEYTTRIIHRFNMRDISLVSKGWNKWSSYFCLFVKVLENDVLLRKCFVFEAGSETEEVEYIIRMAFEVCDLQSAANLDTVPASDVVVTTRLANHLNNVTIDKELIASNIPDIKVECREISKPIRSRRSFACSMIPNFMKCKENKHIDVKKAEGDELHSSEAKLLIVNTRPRSSSSSSSGMFVNLSDEKYKKITRNLARQTWFHGLISREESEILICEDGQFLVRQSPNIDKQFVLTGMYSNHIKQICLVGNDGNISSMKGTFETIVDLIQYYNDHHEPLISQGLLIYLNMPVKRSTPVVLL